MRATTIASLFSCLLAGCAAFGNAAFPDHGEEVGLQNGHYVCTGPDKDSFITPYDLVVQVSKNGHQYVFAGNESTWKIAFFASGANLKIASATVDSPQGKEKYYLHTLVHENTFTVYTLNMEKPVIDLMKQEKVTPRDVGFLETTEIRGSSAAMRSFLKKAVSLTENLEIFAICKRQ